MVRIDLPNEATEPEVLREALAGRVPNLPATAVLARIAGADLPNVDRASLLRDVAMNSETDVVVRAGAVRTLTRIDWAVALSTAVDLIEDENDLLSSTAALALGRLGETDQLEILEPHPEGGFGQFDLAGRGLRRNADRAPLWPDGPPSRVTGIRHPSSPSGQWRHLLRVGTTGRVPAGRGDPAGER